MVTDLANTNQYATNVTRDAQEPGPDDSARTETTNDANDPV
jgi:hypothetical protein